MNSRKHKLSLALWKSCQSNMKRLLLFGSVLAMLSPTCVLAHAFGQKYTLPIPVWLYLYGGTATLLFSFLLIGFFVKKDSFRQSRTINFSQSKIVHSKIFQWAGIILKISSVLLLFFTVLTGLIGVDKADLNFNMTFFWIIFLLGFSYFSSAIGNFWPLYNPIRILADSIEYFHKDIFKGLFSYPRRLGYYPALFLYFLLIWLELETGVTPFILSVLIIAYVLISFSGMIFFGKQNWFRYGDFLSVFLKVFGKAAPLYLQKGKLYMRFPFYGLLKPFPHQWSLLIFLFLMLSSTAYDSFRETAVWLAWYGQYFASGESMAGYNRDFFETIVLIMSPMVFLLIYLFFTALMKILIKSALSLRELAFHFAYSLVPIIIAYNLAHYSTLLFFQGQNIVRLVSDPFGFGWNLFQTAKFQPDIGLLDTRFIWHAQVVLIVLGHIIAVYIAHLLALKIFRNHKKALLSQLPMLFLMITYTFAGLWLLSQPLTAGSGIAAQSTLIDEPIFDSAVRPPEIPEK